MNISKKSCGSIVGLMAVLLIGGCTSESEKDGQQNVNREQDRQERLAAMAASIKTPLEIAPGTVLISVKAMGGSLLQFNYDMSSTSSELKRRLEENQLDLIRSACQNGHPVRDMGAKARYVWSIKGKEEMALEIDDSMCQPHQKASVSKEAK
jgi:heme exporter protein D